MPLSLAGDLGGSILPASYWRGRLNQLLDADPVSLGQLSEIDSLLLQIDEFERRAADGDDAQDPVDRISDDAL